jgi:hypothetical protein
MTKTILLYQNRFVSVQISDLSYPRRRYKYIYIHFHVFQQSQTNEYPTSNKNIKNRIGLVLPPSRVNKDVSFANLLLRSKQTDTQWEAGAD